MTTTDASPAPTMAAAREEHIALYHEESNVLAWAPNTSALVTRDAIEHGWAGASAELAERLRALITEAEETIARRHPFPILKRLDAIVTELEDGLGK